MSDKERDTTDDSSSEPESLHDEIGEKCPYCRIYKVMAESRLFEVPGRWSEGMTRNQWRGYFQGLEGVPYYRIKEGSNKGCRFCGLLVDAFTAWGKKRCGLLVDAFAAWEKGQGIYGPMSRFKWDLHLRDGQFLINLYAALERDLSIDVSVFRGRGMCSVSCSEVPS